MKEISIVYYSNPFCPDQIIQVSFHVDDACIESRQVNDKNDISEFNKIVENKVNEFKDEDYFVNWVYRNTIIRNQEKGVK